MNKKLLGALLLLLAALLSACAAGGGETNFLEEQRPIAPKAVELYETKAKCLSCHGSELQGRMGEKTNIRRIGAKLSKEEIYATIRDGKGLMNGFEKYLEPEEMETLAEWLSTLK